MDLLPAEPKRILQLYDPTQQAQFKAMTVLDRLEWLEAINRLYWQGVEARRKNTPQKKSA